MHLAGNKVDTASIVSHIKNTTKIVMICLVMSILIIDALKEIIYLLIYMYMTVCHIWY